MLLQIETDPMTIRRFNTEVQMAATNIYAFKRKVLGLILILPVARRKQFPSLG